MLINVIIIVQFWLLFYIIAMVIVIIKTKFGLRMSGLF